jgi:hypothetical protein
MPSADAVERLLGNDGRESGRAKLDLCQLLEKTIL